MAMKYDIQGMGMMTAKQAADYCGIPLHNIRSRLSMGKRKPEEVFAPLNQARYKSGRVTSKKARKVTRHLILTEDMKERMYFDPLGHWKLINKCL